MHRRRRSLQRESALNASADHPLEPDDRRAAPEAEDADPGASWLAALTIHVALAVLAFGLPAPREQTRSPPEPDALVVTLIVPPEQISEPNVEPAVGAPPAPAEPTGSPARFDVPSGLVEPPTEPLDLPRVLASPAATTAAPPVSDQVRSVLARLRDCSAAGADDRIRDAACPPGALQLTEAGAHGDGRFDPRAPPAAGVSAAWASTTAFVAAHVIDASVFDGRAGGKPVIESRWASYAKVNPLLRDSRIFDAMTGEIVIAEPPAEP